MGIVVAKEKEERSSLRRDWPNLCCCCAVDEQGKGGEGHRQVTEIELRDI